MPSKNADEQQWTSHLQQELTTQLQYLQEQLAVGITPKDVSTFFYDLPNVPPRRSKLVVPDADHKLRILNLVDVFDAAVDSLEGRLGSEFVYSGMLQPHAEALHAGR